MGNETTVQTVIGEDKIKKTYNWSQVINRRNAPLWAAGGTLALLVVVMLLSPNIEWLDQRQRTKLAIDSAEREIVFIQNKWAEQKRLETALTNERDIAVQRIMDTYAPKIQDRENQMISLSEEASAKREEIDALYAELLGDLEVPSDIVKMESEALAPSFQ